MFFDPLYLFLLLPGMALAAWASFKVKNTFNKYSTVGSRSGLTGAQVARMILDRNGLQDVPIELSDGHLSDHYNPQTRSLHLSSPVYRSTSIASLGVAAHEAGHALQHKTQYAPLQLRTLVVPLVSYGSNLSWIFIMIGIFLASAGSAFGFALAKLGVIIFAFGVLFSIITLPVEFNASRRAKDLLQQYAIIGSDEAVGVAAVLNAAAMTYVAAAVTAILQLLYWVIRLGLLGGRDD